MRIIPLPEQTKALLGFNRKIILTYADINAWQGGGAWTSGTAQAIIPPNALGGTSATLPVPTIVGNFLANVTTAFASSGGAITHLYLSMGDSGSATRYVPATTVDLINTGWVSGTFTRYAQTSANYISATATITGQTIASLNAGVVEIYCYIEDGSALATIGTPLPYSP